MPHWVYRLSWVAGFVAWLAVGIPMLARLADGTNRSDPTLWVWFGSYLGFGLLFSSAAADLLGKLSPRTHQAILLLEVALVSTALLAYPGYSTTAILFILTTVHAINLWSLSQGLVLIGVQTLVMVLGLSLANRNWVEVGVTALAYLAFQFFALMSTEVAQREARAKEELGKVNAQLKATQALLGESSKVSERVRIARELHDLMGHQLTALSLNLEVASHTEGEKAKQHVVKAQQIARDLLEDVRGVVSSMRDSSVNLETALRALVESVPRPAIHLWLAPGLILENPEKAHTLVRCVQEIITNALRHAEANNLWISIQSSDQGIMVHARDDGRGTRKIQSGNGLVGMQERLEQFGGRLEVYSQPGEGFSVDAVLPV